MANVQPSDVAVNVKDDSTVDLIEKAKSLAESPGAKKKKVKKEKPPEPRADLIPLDKKKKVKIPSGADPELKVRMRVAQENMLKINYDVPKGSNVEVIERMKVSYNLLHIFDVWDWDGNGCVTTDEIAKGLHSAKIKCNVKKLESVVKSVTRRKGKNVHNKEFADVMMRYAKKNMKLLDSWTDQIIQHLPVIPLKNLQSPPQNIDKDADGDEEGNQEKKSGFFKRHMNHGRRRQKKVEIESLLSKSEEKANDLRGRLTAAGLGAAGIGTFFGRALTLQAGYAPAIIAILLWQWGFTLWYHFFNEFTIPQAFYYAAQSGFSVGFGALVETCFGGACKDDGSNVMTDGEKHWTMWMTIFNVLLGSSVIGGALSFFTGWIMSQKSDWDSDVTDHVHREIALKHHGQKKDSKPMCSNLSGNFKIVAFICSVLGAAVIYGMVHEDWSFTQSLYFAITSVSTAGLQGVDDPTDNFSMWFTGLLVYFGVPTYAAALGLLASILTENIEKEKLKEQMGARMSAAEFQVAARKEDGSDSLDFCEFLEMELMRTGKCDEEFLEKVHELFDGYDTSKDGEITVDEMVAGNVFTMFNTLSPDDDTLDFEEFSSAVVALAANLNSLGGSPSEITPEKLKEQWDEANTTDDGKIDMAEFLMYVRSNMLIESSEESEEAFEEAEEESGKEASK
jgi:Ca2+-binding EF-hand superfamily protein